MERKEKIRFLILRTLGNFFILFTIFGFVATFGPAVYYEVNFRVSNVYGVHYVVASEPSASGGFGEILARHAGKTEIPDSEPVQNSSQGLFDSILSGNKEQILVPPNTSFSIVIPRIGASEAVTANVDPSNETQFMQVLQHSIAHSMGTALPGMDGTIYMFAHSAASFLDVGRYNAVFYLLKDMQKGDNIYVYYENKRYNYVVYDTKIIDANDTSYMHADLGKGERLILQTCWPPGTTWKRFLVFAKPKKV